MKPNVGHVVLAAGVGAAADLNANFARLVVADRLHTITENFSQVARLRDAQIAGLSAWAAYDIGDVMNTRFSQPELQQLLMYHFNVGQGHIGKQDVLCCSSANSAISVKER